MGKLVLLGDYYVLILMFLLVALVVPTGIVDGPRSVRNGVARKAARDARVAVTRNVAKGKYRCFWNCSLCGVFV